MHPDAIQPVPADDARPAGWSENAVFQVHDSGAGLSVWAHVGRIPDAPHVWEGVIGVFVGGGRLLFSRAFGPSADPGVASSGALAFHCVDPGERWRVTFDGVARTTSEVQLAAGPLPDGAIAPLEVDLAFTAVHPIYGGAADHQTWATAHFDQGGRVRGFVRHGGVTHPIDASGFRDHSYGPRDYARLLGDTWCAAVFPSGRALLALEVWQADGPSFSQGFVFDGETLHPATAVEVPRLRTAAGEPRRFTLAITTEAGIATAEVEQSASMGLTFGRPVGLVGGVDVEDPELPVITEGPARITWDGETADGWIEKSIRPGAPDGPPAAT
jgi:hypothetical protein